MKIEIFKPIPLVLCVACFEKPATNRIQIHRQRTAIILCDDCLEEMANLFIRFESKWISIKDQQPKDSPIVFMYSESNNEYSVGHFVLRRADVPVTHWRPLEPPTVMAAIKTAKET